jgi:GT2 family glycosyltransferase
VTADPLVYIIILSWNGKNDTVECLRSLQLLEYSRCKLLLVDNASSDGTVEAVRQNFPEVELIVNERNLRFAGGNNVGINYAVAHGAEYVLLLNNDTVVDRALVRTLVDAAESAPAAGMAGPKIYYYHERNRLWYAGGEIDWKKGWMWHVGVREDDQGQYDKRTETDFISGCCMLVKRRVIETVGAFDESYYIYGEDVDWCVRASRAGFLLEFVPQAKLWHKLSVSSGGHFSWFKNWNKLKSQIRLIFRYSKPLYWLTIPVWICINVVRGYFNAKRNA